MNDNVQRDYEIQMSLMAAVHELFGGESGDITLPDGKKVLFHPAKFRHLSGITALFQSFISGLTAEELDKVLKTVSLQQEEKIKAGESPFQLHTEELVKDVTGAMSLAMKMLEAAVDVLPQYVEQFTNLTSEEFGELELDDSMIVAFGVFTRNYNFFIQRLPPVIVACIVGLKKQQMKATKAGEKGK